MHLFDPGLPWQEISLAGGRPPVRRIVLHAEGGGGASVQAVEFPPDWARPDAGCFDADEEIVVVRGDLVVSGVEMRAGHHAFVPRGATRVDSRSGSEGCLAVAWFSGPPQWRPVIGSAGIDDIRCDSLQRWCVPYAAAGADSSTGPADVVVPAGGTWHWIPAGEPIVRPESPALVRTWPVLDG